MTDLYELLNKEFGVSLDDFHRLRISARILSTQVKTNFTTDAFMIKDKRTCIIQYFYPLYKGVFLIVSEKDNEKYHFQTSKLTKQYYQTLNMNKNFEIIKLNYETIGGKT